MIATLSNDVLCRATVQTTVDALLAALAPATRARDLAKQRHDLASLGTEIANLTTAIAKGRHLPPLLDALTDRQARREALDDALQHEDALDVTSTGRTSTAASASSFRRGARNSVHRGAPAEQGTSNPYQKTRPTSQR